MANIVGLDDQKERILRNEKKKVKDEVRGNGKLLGLDEFVPRHNQDEYRQLKDMHDNENQIKERMAFAKEKRIKENEQKKKDNRKTPKQLLNMILMHEERKAKDAYDARRIVYPAGGFEEYESCIRPFSYRVLLKKIRDDEHDGIVIPETYDGKQPYYRVICFNDECEGINVGDIVMTEACAGIEIVSKGNVYNIVFADDIICRFEGMEA